MCRILVAPLREASFLCSPAKCPLFAHTAYPGGALSFAARDVGGVCATEPSLRFVATSTYGGIWPACGIEGPVRAIIFSDGHALACALVRPPPPRPSARVCRHFHIPASLPAPTPPSKHRYHRLQERTQRPVRSGVPSAPSVRPCVSFVRRATANA